MDILKNIFVSEKNKISNFIITTCFYLLVLNINAQKTITIQSKQVIAYYSNGNIESIKNFLLDTCKFDDENWNYIVELCLCGPFKEYYTNGVLKTSGHYDVVEYLKNYEDKTPQKKYLKSGIWHFFDSLGNFERLIIHTKRFPLVRYRFKQDIMIVKNDSSILELKNYNETTSYLVKRSKKNKYLILNPKRYSGHNYWKIFDEQFNITSDNFDNKANIVSTFKEDDTHSSQKHFNISNLKSGIYYIYYQSGVLNNSYEYELKIILEDLKE
ncbi:MAG: hypothetical protein EAY66_02690 [Sphingobacteriales bacterium]|nr:MAG: hypothetical protein EAY66_02690 [Sphingobacteriales bacterium]